MSAKKVDINSMDTEQIDDLSARIGSEIAKIMDEANEKSNAILSAYGLQTEIGYIITKKETKNTKVKNR